MQADTQLKDHTLKEIARPNNDTFYTSALLDLRAEPIILDMPAFDSKYVSLMVTSHDHYVDVPKSTRLGDASRESFLESQYCNVVRGTLFSLAN